MGLFMQRPEEEQNDWAGLPSEPLDPHDGADTLGSAPAVDPLALGLGAPVSSIAFPIAPPAPDAAPPADEDPEAPEG